MTPHGRALAILRHAKSEWPPDVPDLDRPLAPRGIRQAPEAGRWLADHAPRIDLAVCSPAARTRGTWELVAPELPDPPEIRYEARMHGATAGTLLRLVRELPDEANIVLLIGHNPGLEDLIAYLTGVGIGLKTSAAAVLSGDLTWPETDAGRLTLRSGPSR